MNRGKKSKNKTATLNNKLTEKNRNSAFAQELEDKKLQGLINGNVEFSNELDLDKYKDGEL